MWFCWWCLGGHCRWGGGRNLRGCCCCYCGIIGRHSTSRSVSRTSRLGRLSRGPMLFGSRKHILVVTRSGSRTLVDFSRMGQGGRSNTGSGRRLIWTISIFWSGVLTARIFAIRDLHFCCSFDYIKESAMEWKKKFFSLKFSILWSKTRTKRSFYLVVKEMLFR